MQTTLNTIKNYLVGILAAIIILLAALLGISQQRINNITKRNLEQQVREKDARNTELDRRNRAISDAQHTNTERRQNAENKPDRSYFE